MIFEDCFFLKRFGISVVAIQHNKLYFSHYITVTSSSSPRKSSINVILFFFNIGGYVVDSKQKKCSIFHNLNMYIKDLYIEFVLFNT